MLFAARLQQSAQDILRIRRERIDLCDAGDFPFLRNRDHNVLQGHGPPHFHARYGGKKATVRLSDGFVNGDISKRAETLVLEWWRLHRDELVANWNRAETSEPLMPIAPLE